MFSVNKCVNYLHLRRLLILNFYLPFFSPIYKPNRQFPDEKTDNHAMLLAKKKNSNFKLLVMWPISNSCFRYCFVAELLGKLGIESVIFRYSFSSLKQYSILSWVVLFFSFFDSWISHVILFFWWFFLFFHIEIYKREKKNCPRRSFYGFDWIVFFFVNFILRS